ncbi:hypothetical protein J2848_004885 [Azospirillum lipoferum]|nr:hypothetical protein [Azospirillum lipoferum]
MILTRSAVVSPARLGRSSPVTPGTASQALISSGTGRTMEAPGARYRGRCPTRHRHLAPLIQNRGMHRQYPIVAAVRFQVPSQSCQIGRHRLHRNEAHRRGDPNRCRRTRRSVRRWSARSPGNRDRKLAAQGIEAARLGRTVSPLPDSGVHGGRIADLRRCGCIAITVAIEAMRLPRPLQDHA